MKKSIQTSNAPKAASYFSQGILTSGSHDQLELSGQIGLDPSTMKLVSGGVEAETKQAFANVQAVLEEAGWSMSDIIKVRVYLTSMDDYATMNSVYETMFTQNSPTRVAIAVSALPLGAKVELDCTASR